VTMLPRISRLAVSEPGSELSQDEVLALLGLDGDEFAQGVFGRSAVSTRSLGLSAATLERTLQGRTARTEDQLFAEAVEAVSRLEVDPAEIGTVVTSSLYSLGGPTLAHRLVEGFRMDPATDKYHVVGVGCASAVPLVRLVAQSLDTHPGKKGLIVAAESMSGLLSRATPDDERSKTVGSAIFGDGCAAAVIERGTAGPAIGASKVHQIRGTLGIVRMELSDEDSYLHLERDLPEVAAAGIPDLVDEFLSSAALTRRDIEHWIVHPGGRRILECVREALSLSREQLDASYDVLATRGNVGTPSIFYVLNETIERHRPGPGERGLMVTVGPGVTVGLMLLVF
jgi:predicted naringenin-chalcone synthase